ncbi:hypothetical protein EV201_0900 [Ancylomarina subtilis]|uniref:Uncharacterized protein n=1 Tax=Ancylomarina subtilis TaxID=1639035 RepID=A0A4Q7VJJ3_9BACT|nr:hypothetical protein [Ancylomarina subtilis]RZT96264.1 hypothetical protein EV201_0900 [Ancylomarina subtilis]
MTPDKEKQVLESLYDRLFDAITYSPDGKVASWHKDTTFIQFAKNIVINPDDFVDMMNPGNPNGSLTKAELFSAMVDALPNTDAMWSDSGQKISDVYGTIVRGANSDSKPNPDQQKLYQQAFNFLNVEVEKKTMSGVKTVTEPSPEADAYDEAQAAYITAVGGYRTAYDGYDLDKKEDQRAWNAVAPGLQLTLDQAWNKWVRASKAEVEEAQNALVSTINDAVKYVIAESIKMINEQHQMAPSTPGGNPWLPSYALPTNWYDDSCKASKLTFKSSYLNKTASSSATQYASEASGSWGLWHASGGVSGSSEEQRSHMDAENLTLEAELINVTIKRSWFNPLILKMKDWFVNGIEKGGISNAQIENLLGIMPLIPTGFIIARNVKITADFSSEDKSFIAKSISTKASGGWGPFSVSGSYSHSSSKSNFQAKFDGGTLELPGLQLIGWINSIMPYSPPEAAKQLESANQQGEAKLF